MAKIKLVGLTVSTSAEGSRKAGPTAEEDYLGRDTVSTSEEGSRKARPTAEVD